MDFLRCSFLKESKVSVDVLVYPVIFACSTAPADLPLVEARAAGVLEVVTRWKPNLKSLSWRPGAIQHGLAGAGVKQNEYTLTTARVQKTGLTRAIRFIMDGLTEFDDDEMSDSGSLFLWKPFRCGLDLFRCGDRVRVGGAAERPHVRAGEGHR